jgi:hypothetical protein
MDQNKPEERTEKQNGERSLPRGLEHVSNIFLRPQLGRLAPDNSQTASPEQSGTRPADASVSVVLRPCAFSGREALTAVIKKQAGSIEEGMKAIDTNIPCEGSGSIDVLAIDGKNQLVIIDLEERPQDGLLLRGIAHAEWMIRNLPNVRRMYHDQTVNFALPPRIFLMAPEFSSLFKSVASHITSWQIDCLKYHGIALSGGVGIFFEHVMRTAVAPPPPPEPERR